MHSFAPDNTISTCGKLTTYMMKGAYVSADVWSHYQLSCNDAFHFINVTGKYLLATRMAFAPYELPSELEPLKTPASHVPRNIR